MYALQEFLQPLAMNWRKDFTVGREVIIRKGNEYVHPGTTGTITRIETAYDEQGKLRSEKELNHDYRKGQVVEVSFDFPILIENNLHKRLSIESKPICYQKANYHPSDLLISNASLLEEIPRKHGFISQVLKDGSIEISKSGSFFIVNAKNQVLLTWMSGDKSLESPEDMAFTLALVRSLGTKEFEKLLALKAETQ